MDYQNLSRVWNLGDKYTLFHKMYLGQLVGDWRILRDAAQSQMRAADVSVFIEKQSGPTAHVKNLSFRRIIKDDMHEPNHGWGTLVMADPDVSYIQDGRCTITAGDTIQINIGFDGLLLTRFTGKVKNAQINTTTHELQIRFDDYGYTLKEARTSGDYSDYNTPVTLVNQLLSQVEMGDASWENETGTPATYTFGNTTLSNRSYWAIIHGALLGVNYVFYFDELGVLQCKPRDYYYDTGMTFYDSDIKDLTHKATSEIINKKSVAHSGEYADFNGFTLGDSVRWGQETYTKTDERSVARYGERADYETDELIDGWDNAYAVATQAILYYAWERQIFTMRIPGRPELQIMDRIGIHSD